MREFIFNWRIENMSYSWHKKGEEIVSPSFVANTLQNTTWTLRLCPKGYQCADWLSLYLNREKDDGPQNFLIGCEFSCVSASNLTLTTRISQALNESFGNDSGKGFLYFLQRHEVFVRRKSLYLPRDILTLRCRMWKHEDGGNEFGQCFGYTRLEIERIFSVEDMKPRITREKSVHMHSNKQNKSLISVSIIHEEDGLKIEIKPTNTEGIKFSTFKFTAVGRNKKSWKYTNSWLDKPCREVWRKPFSSTENKASNTNKLKLTCEFIYSTGKETKSIETIKPCPFKYPDFTWNSILSCIPSGKLSDYPTICKDLWDLYSNQTFCDVELKTQTRSFWVHKAVLCARSAVFHAMLTDDMKGQARKCVEIDDLEADILEKFLAFVYTDSFEESQSDAVFKLYIAAYKYQVERLKVFCCSYFMDNIDDLNVCELLMLADKHSDSHLKSKVEDYVMEHHERIFGSSTWKEFSEKQPLLAVKTMLCKYEERRDKEKPAKEYKLSSYPYAMDDFESLYQSQAVSDIVVQSTGTTFPVHKTMLCAGSSRLMRALTRGKSIDPLKMECLEQETVSRLLLFLYTDSLTDLMWEDASKLYGAAVAYQIERLKFKCSCFFLDNLDDTTASRLLQLAHEYRDAKLKSLVEDYISLHDEEVTLDKGWAKISKTDPPKRIDTRLSKRLRLENNS